MSTPPSVGRAGFPSLLLNRALIAPGSLAEAQSQAASERIELADAVVTHGVREDDSYATLADAAGVDLIALDGVTSSELAVRLVPEKLARRHLVVPLSVDNRVLTYATCRPFNAEAESDLAFASGRRTAVKVATRSAVGAALELCYPQAKPLEVLTERLRTEKFVPTTIPASGMAASAVIEMCHQIVGRALEAGPGDLHLDCGADGPSIRYRTNGSIQPMLTVPYDVFQNICERFKIMARVGIAVRNRPQNAAFQLAVNGRLADVRLSTNPTADGESIVMRVIDAAAAAGVGTTQAKKHARPRVLVTDDEPITRMLVKVLLEKDRYDVIEATNGREAVEMAMRERPSLLLIDLNMPVMDGYEAIGALRREFARRDLPIIVLTAADGESVERRVLDLGADDFLIKPFEPAVLMARVNAVFRRSNLVAA